MAEKAHGYCVQVVQSALCGLFHMQMSGSGWRMRVACSQVVQPLERTNQAPVQQRAAPLTKECNMRGLIKYTAAGLLAATATAWADETCNSPYMTGLIKGQEDFVHVWTLGVQGLGDGQDKLVTIDANPKSKTYGKVIHSVSTGARGEAHHMGFTDDRRYLWAGGLADNKIHVFDVGSNPAKPKLVRTISDISEKSGYVGPHTFYALPGRMLIAHLSNAKDKGGVTGMAIYNNKGEFVAKHDMPVTEIGGAKGDGYGYDIAVNPAKNALLTSSFTGYNNYMRNLGELVKDPAAMKNFGNTMVMWDLKAMQPKQVFSVPGAPLEIRWSLKKGDNWAITASALTSKLWLVKQDAKGAWAAKEVGTIGDPAKIPLPVDISITADAKGLWVNTFMDGTTRYFDISNPEAPKEIYSKQTGKQANMVSQSWDGKRVYVTSSLLENWDKGGADNEQFLRAFNWNGKELKLAFEVDFAKEKLGRAHHMKFTAKRGRVAALDSTQIAQAQQ
jgi:methanethiol oxidase